MDLLDKLHERLVAAVDAAGENAFPTGLTVADVYQRLIPYRVVRSQVGVVELAEYEHALLRLLSGERHLVEVTDPTVRLEIQRELASLNPILGIYRDYSGAHLKLASTPREEGTAERNGPNDGPSGAAPPRVEPPSSARPEVGADDAGEQLSPIVPSGASADLADQRAAARAGTGAHRTVEACASCGESLPEMADLLFCPFCGAAQGPRPCARCGASMERGWSFCPRCGAARAGSTGGA